MFTFLGKFRSSSTPKASASQLEAGFQLEVTETEIINNRPNGVVERILLSDLKAVIIETNDSGPASSDVWIMLVGSHEKSGCVFPQGATGEKSVIEVLFKLPGFDYKVFIEAMSSPENRRFLCWQTSA